MTTSSSRRRGLRVVAASVALLAVACSDDDQPGTATTATPEASTTATTTPATTTAPMTQTAASTTTGGQGDADTTGRRAPAPTDPTDLAGQTVTILGPGVGAAAASAAAGAVPLERATGIDVVFSGSSNVDTDMRVAANNGTLPDIAVFTAPATITNAPFVDLVVPPPDGTADEVRQNFDPGFLAPVTTNGRLLAVPLEADVKSLVWYSPPVFQQRGYTPPHTWSELVALQDEIKADGGTPWCIGIEAGERTGGMFTDWVEDFMLRLNGPDVYDQWVDHAIPFNDPKVKAAVRQVGDLWFGPGNVLGGPEAIASTGVDFAGLPLLDGDCVLYRQGNSFATAARDADPSATFGSGGDLDAFSLPPMSDRFGAVVLSGADYAVALNDRPATTATLQFLATAEYAEARIETGSGGFVSPNRTIGLARYADPLDASVADLLMTADVVRVDGSDTMPPNVGSGTFWTEGTNYVNRAEDVDTFVDKVEASWPQ